MKFGVWVWFLLYLLDKGELPKWKTPKWLNSLCHILKTTLGLQKKENPKPKSQSAFNVDTNGIFNELKITIKTLTALDYIW